ncbi:MAG: hypothetical protein C6Y22_18905 [Hapalosiphonaceae cyanobacterium JJU2]|nr:MAG: hypothetical protein C6Y22_18905 [Hapalosiphonaceae cyanobacterium JJU2]
MKFSWLLVLLGLSPTICSILVSQNRTTAQIVPDGNLGGTENSVVNPDVINGIPSDRIDGGAIRGSNLFHSFQDFNVNAGRGAYFSNPAGIANILTRVTGGNPSNILGRLGVLGNANLFLLNPRGISFGPNASLDLRGGSFFGTTANSVLFDNFEFSASNPQPVPLLNVNIPIGLRFRDNPGSISNNGSLQVQTGKTLALVGGNVNLDAGSLIAPEGKVELGGLTQAGTIGLNADGNFSFPNGITRADVLLRNGSRIDVADQGKGSVNIIARNLNIETGSIVSAGIKPNLTASTSVPGNVTLDATEAIKINGQSLVENVADQNATGNAGDINVKANYLELTGGGQIRTRTLGRQSDAGDINIVAGDIYISNPVYWPRTGAPAEDKPALDASNFKNDGTVGIGRSGNISLTADGDITLIGEGVPGTVNLENKVISTYSASNRGLGEGDISLVAKGSILLNNANLISTSFGEDNLAASGNILLQGDTSVSLTNNSQIAATTYGKGNPGNVRLISKGPILVESSVIFTDLRNTVTKSNDAGNIFLSGQSVFITKGSTITARTLDNSKFGGTIQIDAKDIVEISGINPLFSDPNKFNLTRSRDVYSTLVTNTVGNAQGPAGDIIINADTLRISDGGSLKAATQGAFSGGDITVNARVIDLAGGGKIINTASRTGNAGKINLNASDSITISGSNPNFQQVFREVVKRTNTGTAEFRLGRDDTGASGIYAYTLPNSSAQGGSLKITTGRLLVNNGARINVGSQGTGRAGNIEVTAAKDIRLDNNALITAQTRGGQGNITLNSRDLILRRNSNITTNATGTVRGGNINISTGNLVALENSDITANAQRGSGGDISIKADYLFRSKDSDITAASELGQEFSGKVEINTTDVDPSQGLIELPENIIDLTNQIAQNPCQKASGSSFNVTGRGGLPSSPSDSFSSNETRVDLVEPVAITSNSPNLRINQSPVIRQTTKNIVPAQGWIFNKKGEVVLTAYDPTNSSQGRTSQATAACSVNSDQ